MQILEFDTVVIGSGLAGLTAAFHSSKYGKVAVVTKSQLDTSNSYYAQGGIAAAITDDDSPEQHLRDTSDAGRGLCDIDAVEVLVNEGKERVLDLISLGMAFDKKEGNYVLGLEGGHRKRRILHAGGDATGKELTCFMLQKVKTQKNIQAFEYVAAIHLLKEKNCILGVQCYDFTTQKNIVFKSKAVILATGGLSRIFARSTNPHTATGDGIAMAYEAGAKIADMEFIQFHPSALYVPGKEAYLISEAVRGEGAWLLDENGNRFMKDIHPQAELAPRDVVAYNIFRQIQKSESNHVYLSLRHLEKTKIEKRFYHINSHLKEYGFDLSSDLLPISPAAHYMVGGIKTNLEAETNISGLFVCGEAASTGVMGANRLASNSLLECLVFGKRASEKAAKIKEKECNFPEINPINVDPSNEKIFLEIQNKLAETMTKYLGIVRTQKEMEDALRYFNQLETRFENYNSEYNLLKIKNSVQICKLITMAALNRKESRGGHIREDFKNEKPEFEHHSIQQKDRNIQFEPVRK
ncbi:L-aspartate oxidase [Maribellus maritimus]|uniref:L-aspartate oxidase n=1 Tax=Maribellus maritimus TaxID=2870838 RepID=UPI001EEB9522|nr:L-aspartate oxidase [Maribellus maritimus]MCG6189013.1 L-aspartate oxidase [Maribellus maritimus]